MTARTGRSSALKLLIILFLAAGVLGILRVYQAALDWKWLLYYQIAPGPGYFVVYGVVQAGLGLAAGAALWWGVAWAPRAARSGALFLAAWYWADRLLLSKSSASWANWPFSLGVTLVLLAYVFVVLAHPRQREYFAKR